MPARDREAPDEGATLVRPRARQTTGGSAGESWRAQSGEPPGGAALQATMPAVFAASQKVFGRFILQRQLGRGGMGVVWLATDCELEREVALKFLPEIVVADPAAVSDLKRETRRALELTHPGIVRVYDFHQEQRLAGISMEYIDGKTLTELRLEQPDQIFEPEQLEDWAGQLVDALDYAHNRARVVHRDLKPANLMVNARGEIKITDFGISATVSDTMTRASRVGETSGTPAYASPQQLMGAAPTPLDDVYSLGATFYELITGKPPFYSGNLLLQVQSRLPPSLAERRRELAAVGALIPPAWEETVAACLQKDPGARPANVVEVGRRLRGESVVSAAAVSGLDTAAPPPLPPEFVEPVEEAPPPEPRKPATVRAPALPRPRARSRGWWKWLLFLFLAGTAAAGVWLGDVPNRITALLETRRGHRALVRAEWAEALESFKDALVLRPQDRAMRENLDAAQRQWLDGVRGTLVQLPPEEAQALVASPENKAVAERLSEPFAGEWRSLVRTITTNMDEYLRQALAAIETRAAEGRFQDAYAELDRMKASAGGMPEYALTANRVREAEVRRHLGEATALAGRMDYAGALARLQSAEAVGVLSNDVAAARAQVRRMAAAASLGALVAAIRGGRVDDVALILETGGNVSRAEAATAAKALIEATTLEGFRATLSRAGFGFGADAENGHLEQILVETLRDRFTDRAAVSGYLAAGYLSWARELLALRQPGFALYALERAVAEGATPDPGLEREARAAMARELDITVLLAPIEQTTREAPMPDAPLRDAAREVLEATIGSWVTLAEFRPVGGRRAPIELHLRLGPLTARDEPSEETRTQRYQRGWNNERNPEYTRLAGELREAQQQSAELDQKLEQMRNQGNNDAERVFWGLMTMKIKGDSDRAHERVAELERQLANTPAGVRNPSYADEPYRRITHDVTYSVMLTATLERAGADLAPWLSWNAAESHQTVEVVGDASRGVPVQSPSYPPMGDVARALGTMLAGEIRSDRVSLIDRVEVATFTVLEQDLVANGADATAAAGQRWGLARLWRLSGVGVRQTGELERSVREQLGLPAAEHVAEEAPPPVVTSPNKPSTPASKTSTQSVVFEPPPVETKPLPVETKPLPVVTEPTVVVKTPPPTITVPPSTEFIYTVQSGDTVRKILDRFRITAAELYRLNPELRKARIRVGQRIRIPQR